jgi:hypothetical protein
MIIYIEQDKKILAIIIKANFKSEGIKFFTPNNFSQQLGYMKREKNYLIRPHLHNSVTREVKYTKEVLFIKSGKVRVDFYNEKKKYFESRILEKGDVILLAYGGHGFKMIEPSEIIEVKQGPYSDSLDKSLFDSIPDHEINIKYD